MIWQLDIEATHNEADNSLANKTEDHRILRSQVVDHEGSNEGPGHVEQVDYYAPAEHDGQGVRTVCHANSIIRLE